MTGMLAIARMEARMHLRSKRFWLLAAAAGLFNLKLYTSALYNNELNGTLTYFAEPSPLHVILAALTGLIASHRLRSTGAHTLLFTRPVSSFSLLAGQVLGGYVFLLPLVLWWCLPLGLFLRGRYEMDFAVVPLLYTLVFWWTPMTLGVLALAVWMKTWFHNNIVAAITLAMSLGIIFGIANSPILNPSIEGMYGYQKIHTPMPFFSCFAQDYISRFAGLSESGHASFGEPESWKLLVMSLLFPVLFLHLATYRMRRTEPQRKVFLRYGRHWFHAPTYVRTVFDLFRFDPRVGLKMHTLTALLLFCIGAIWAGNMSDVANKQRGAMGNMNMNMGSMNQEFGPGNWVDKGMVDPEVLASSEQITLDSWDGDFTLRFDEPTSGRLFCFYPRRGEYKLDRVELAGKPLEYVDGENSFRFVHGVKLNDVVGSGPVVLKLHGVRHASLASVDHDRTVWQYSGQGIGILNAVQKSDLEFEGQPARFLTTGTQSWPADLLVEVPANLRMFESPVIPEVEELGETNRFAYQLPEAMNRNGSRIRYYNPELAVSMRLGDFDETPALDLRVLVPIKLAETMRQFLELTPDLFDEFAQLQQMNNHEPIALNYSRDFAVTFGESNDAMVAQLKDLRTASNVYRITGKLPGPLREQYFRALRTIETSMLRHVQKEWYFGRAVSRDCWDLESFLTRNLENGLNHRIAQSRFVIKAYRPISAILQANRIESLQAVASRTELNQQQTIPVFQMLYLWMGHDAWSAMLPELRLRMKDEVMTVDSVQDIAQRHSPVPLDDFFDYWLRTGSGFPRFHVREAWFDRIQLEGDEAERFAVHVVVDHTAPIRIPVPLRLEVTQAPVIDEILWVNPGEPVVWDIDVRQPPQQVYADPGGWLMSSPWYEDNFHTHKPAEKRLEERKAGGTS